MGVEQLPFLRPCGPSPSTASGSRGRSGSCPRLTVVPGRGAGARPRRRRQSPSTAGSATGARPSEACSLSTHSSARTRPASSRGSDPTHVTRFAVGARTSTAPSGSPARSPSTSCASTDRGGRAEAGDGSMFAHAAALPTPALAALTALEAVALQEEGETVLDCRRHRRRRGAMRCRWPPAAAPGSSPPTRPGAGSLHPPHSGRLEVLDYTRSDVVPAVKSRASRGHRGRARRHQRPGRAPAHGRDAPATGAAWPPRSTAPMRPPSPRAASVRHQCGRVRSHSRASRTVARVKRRGKRSPSRSTAYLPPRRGGPSARRQPGRACAAAKSC